MARRRFRKSLIGKPSAKHSGTLVANTGPSTVPDNMVIVETDSGARSIDGAPQTIQDRAVTDETCRVGDTIKYVNLHIQAGPRNNIDAQQDRVGWIEWAFVCVRENETILPITRTGLQTIGDIATNMYRGECVFTGMIPIGNAQPAVGEITLKIPKRKQKIKLGDQWRFITAHRAVDSASTSTAVIRLIKSFNFICYS